METPNKQLVEVGRALARPATVGEVSGLTRTRKILALSIAAISDAISLFAQITPPVQWVVDGVTAALLFGILGFRWQLLPVLAVEAIPGVATFPSWMLAVGVLVGVTPTK